MDMTHGERIFVYGTLRRGEKAHALMQQQAAVFLGGAVLDGFEVQDLGAFPAITPCEGKQVTGELYRIRPSAWPALDRYEGEGRLFHRQLREVQRPDGSRERAWVYVYAGL